MEAPATVSRNMRSGDPANTIRPSQPARVHVESTTKFRSSINVWHPLSVPPGVWGWSFGVCDELTRQLHWCWVDRTPLFDGENEIVDEVIDESFALGA
jgi:hypothetical protein